MGVAKKLKILNFSELVNYISEVISKESGNILGETQKTMVVNRLKKRMLDLKIAEPGDYYDYLHSNYQKEKEHLLGLLTTHHTFFFREMTHFEFILSNLNKVVESVKARGEKKVKIFCAACSRGQEVYSLAMFFDKHLKSFAGMDYEIVGTDIDIESVKIAKNGVYPYNEVKSIPSLYLEKNWQRGTGKITNFAKVKDHLKEKCKFGTMNLLEPKSYLGANKFDIVFCRNVFIYFDQSTIEECVEKFKGHVYDTGFFITGLSESLKNYNIELNTLAPSVYNFNMVEDLAEDQVEDVKSVDVTAKTPISIIPKPIKIMAVDDSKSILKLMKKIFDADPDFEFVGTAENGLEAIEFLKNNEVDAMTLDIHMPEMDGVSYLEKNFNNKHPKVVVVSSASREDTRYAQKTLSLGASDFVEKPELNNISQRAEEIKNKIKMSFYNSAPVKDTVDKDFKTSYEIDHINNKARVFIANYSDREKVLATLKELKGEQPPIMIFFEGNYNYLEMIKGEFSSAVKNLKVFEEHVINGNDVYLCDYDKHFDVIKAQIDGRKLNVCVFGICSKNVANGIVELGEQQLLLEDLPEINSELKDVASDIFPWTSFSHLGTEYLADKKGVDDEA